MNKQDLIAFEEEIKNIFLEGKIRAPVHLSRGNETPLIEIFFKEVLPEDWVFSTHRSHYHALLKGIPREWVRSEILQGRSIHLMSKEHNFFTSAIVGGVLPIALGVAMAIKRRIDDYPKTKVWAFVGDMASHTGIFYECKKYAKSFNLPLCIVIEDNGLSTNTPTDVVWGIGERTRLLNDVWTVDKWELGKVLMYSYERGFPHINVGEWVTFR